MTSIGEDDLLNDLLKEVEVCIKTGPQIFYQAPEGLLVSVAVFAHLMGGWPRELPIASC